MGTEIDTLEAIAIFSSIKVKWGCLICKEHYILVINEKEIEEYKQIEGIGCDFGCILVNWSQLLDYRW